MRPPGARPLDPFPPVLQLENTGLESIIFLPATSPKRSLPFFSVEMSEHAERIPYSCLVLSISNPSPDGKAVLVPFRVFFLMRDSIEPSARLLA